MQTLIRNLKLALVKVSCHQCVCVRGACVCALLQHVPGIRTAPRQGHRSLSAARSVERGFFTRTSLFISFDFDTFVEGGGGSIRNCT